MILLNKYQISEWAYHQCEEGNDTEEIRNLITHQYYAYKYCRHIKDIEEMWKKITKPDIAYWYWFWVKQRPEIKKYINFARGFKNEIIR